MPLYRADFINTEGEPYAAVTDANVMALPAEKRQVLPLRIPLRGDLLTRHMQSIRPLASAVAEHAQRPVLISSITGPGRVKGVLIARVDGTFGKPAQAKTVGAGGDCVKESRKNCFCANCRAERRAARAR